MLRRRRIPDNVGARINQRLAVTARLPGSDHVVDQRNADQHAAHGHCGGDPAIGKAAVAELALLVEQGQLGALDGKQRKNSPG